MLRFALNKAQVDRGSRDQRDREAEQCSPQSTENVIVPRKINTGEKIAGREGEGAQNESYDEKEPMNYTLRNMNSRTKLYSFADDDQKFDERQLCTISSLVRHSQKKKPKCDEPREEYEWNSPQKVEGGKQMAPSSYKESDDIIIESTPKYHHDITCHAPENIVRERQSSSCSTKRLDHKMKEKISTQKEVKSKNSPPKLHGQHNKSSTGPNEEFEYYEMNSKAMELDGRPPTIVTSQASSENEDNFTDYNLPKNEDGDEHKLSETIKCPSKEKIKTTPLVYSNENDLQQFDKESLSAPPGQNEAQTIFSPQCSTMQFELPVNNQLGTKNLARCRRYFPPFLAIVFLSISAAVYLYLMYGGNQVKKSHENTFSLNHLHNSEAFTCRLEITNVPYKVSYNNMSSVSAILLANELEAHMKNLLLKTKFRKNFVDCKTLGFENDTLVAFLMVWMRHTIEQEDDEKLHLPITTRGLTKVVKQNTCRGQWKKDHCAGALRLGRFNLKKDNIDFAYDGCGNHPPILRSSNGFIASSNFRLGNYRPRDKCEWYIDASNKSFVRLIFKNFETESYYDVLSIYAGYEAEQSLVARCSGFIEKDRDLFITKRNVSMIFTSDAMLQKTGFLIIYQLLKDEFPSSSGCFRDDVTLTAASGGFTSVGYPNRYPNMARCRWTISIAKNKVVTLIIRDFRTRNKNDMLRLFTSREDKTILLETLYGIIKTRKIETNSNLIVVDFSSDFQMTDRGFHVEYFSSNRIGCPGEIKCGDGSCIPRLYACDGTVDCPNSVDEINCESGCGGESYLYANSEGTIVSSFNYPSNYPDDALCTWHVKALNDSHVLKIKLLDFYTELQYDTLDIFSGIGRNKKLATTCSGNDASEEDVVVSSAALTLRFTSDSSVSERGFRALITSFAPGACPGQFECVDQQICILNTWKCDGSNDCSNATDEENCDSRCGNSAEISKEGHLSSQFYPEEYLQDSNCEWRIRTYDDKRVVSLRFLDFSTESKHDEFRIFDGTGRNKTFRAVYSGAVLPPNFESFGSSITLQFKSDHSVNSRGFNISVAFSEKGPCPGRFTCLVDECLNLTKVCDGKPDCRNEIDELHCPSGCGGNRELANTDGYFTSQSFPAYYSDNLRCEWKIYARQGELIQLNFEDFNTENNFDKLQIFQGIQPRSRKYVGYVSGTNTARYFRSRYHQISLLFTTDDSTTRSGFNISYQTGQPNLLDVCPKNAHPIALGMELGNIKNNQISASSSFSSKWAANNSRLNNPHSAWLSGRRRNVRYRSQISSQWLQVDLLQNRLTTGIITQGFKIKSAHLFVRSYEVFHRKQFNRWKGYRDGLDRRNKVFRGNHDGQNFSRVSFNHPFVARYIRIVPRNWTGQYIAMRMEILGCSGAAAFSVGEECGDDDFECGDGTCIGQELICDKNDDCEDKSDELNCAKCRPFQFRCASGVCVLRERRCDGSKDCDDGSDEAGCSRCHGNDFLCEDESICVKRKRVCDGYRDCDDFSDERSCDHDWLCPVHNDYRCEDSKCVSGVNLKCNNYNDCPDQSDERDCDCGVSPKIDETVASRNSSVTNQIFTNERQKRSTQGKRFRRIVGGIDAEPESWPWQVSLEKNLTQDHFCGGAILSPKYIVTAAHCLVAHKADDILIKSGLYFRKNDHNAKSHRAKRVIVHPRYDNQNQDFDIALVELYNNVTINDRTKRICLPPSSHIYHEGQSCWITGWGTVTSRGRRSDALQEAQVEIMTNEQCNRPMWYAGKVTPRMLCAGESTGSVDACQGDSGGPLACQERGGRWFLAGLVSWGIGCGVAYKPGVCTRVTEVVHWIKDVMNKTEG